MRYNVYAESENYYYLKYYRDSYDYKGTDKKIPKRIFKHWSNGKIDDTSGTVEVRVEATRDTATRVEITQEQKEIMDIVSRMVQDKGYILERDISIDGYSKAFTGRTVRANDILKQYNLQRIRATKKLKESLGITDIKGYPFLIVKK